MFSQFSSMALPNLLNHLPGIDFCPVGIFYKCCVSKTLSLQNITKRGAESAGSKIPIIYPQSPADSG